MGKDGYSKFIDDLVKTIKSSVDYDYHDEPIWIIAEWDNSMPE